VQGRQYSGKAEFEKIIVPFGAQPDQIFNLLDLAARDVYHNFFERPAVYLGPKRRLRSMVTEKESEYRRLFEFANKHRYAVKTMLLQPAAVRTAVGVTDDEAAEAQS
jgi:hypothetical protein